MTLAAICLARNEEDIIAETLRHALAYCDRIFVIDNGSTDQTWQIVRDLAAVHPAIVAFEQTTLPYGDHLRQRVYARHHRDFTPDDWWLVLDADEFLAEDPGPVIAMAKAEAADQIWSWQIQFYYTEQDLAEWESGSDSRDRPIQDRRRWYSINWQEPRLFRNDPRRPWNTALAVKIPEWAGRRCSRRILNRHFQYRDPPQIQGRIRLRYGNPNFSRHVKSPDWRDFVKDSRRLQYYEAGSPWQFTAAGYWHFWHRYWLMRARRSLSGSR